MTEGRDEDRRAVRPRGPAGFSLAVVALVAAGAALVRLEGILMPFVVAFFLAALAGPIVSWMKNKGIPTALAVVIIIVVTAIAAFLVGKVFYSQATVFAREAPAYQEKLREGYESISGKLQEHMTGEMKDLVNFRWEDLPLKETVRAVAGALGSLFNTLGTLLLILLYMVFLLAERENFLFRIRQAYDEREGGRIIAAIEQIRKQTENYIVGKTVTSFATGAAVTLILAVFGVNGYFVWGLAVFLLNFIPNIGSVIATVLPLLMAAIQPEPSLSLGTIALLAVFLVAVQFTVGNLLEPRLLGDRLRLSPLVVFLSFLLWGWLWGVPGMILSTPIMATIRIVCENVESLKPVAVLIGNARPGRGAGDEKE